MTLADKRKGLKYLWGKLTKERAEFEGLIVATLARLHTAHDAAFKELKAENGPAMCAYWDGQREANQEMLQWLQAEYNKLKLR